MSGALPGSGRFITLEGGEGAGKSTQIALLARALRDRGLDVVETREPGGTPGAEAIRALLLSGEADRWNPRAEALLFAAARSDHVAKLIRPALERGAWVLCDRYIDSNRAYQSGASGLADTDIMALHNIGSEGLMPDRTLLLTLSMDEAEARVARRDDGKADRFGARGREFHGKVAQAFLDQAAADPDRFRLVDTTGVPEDVHRAILSAIEDMLP